MDTFYLSVKSFTNTSALDFPDLIDPDLLGKRCWFLNRFKVNYFSLDISPLMSYKKSMV